MIAEAVEWKCSPRHHQELFYLEAVSRLSFLRILIVMVALAPSLASAAGRIASGDGSSPAKAFVIVDARNELEGTDVEYAWLRKNAVGWRLRCQSVMTKRKRVYDFFVLEKAGAVQTIYFDITQFFGKTDGMMVQPAR